MKGFKSILILVVLSFLAVADAIAAGGITLFLLLKDGKSETYSLVEKPVLTFAGDSLLIQSATVTTAVPYGYSKVDKIYFDVVTPDDTPSEGGEVPTDIEKALENASYSFAYDGKTVQISGAGDYPVVAVYGLNGMKVEAPSQVSSQQVLISLSALPKGIYVIRVNNRSFKIVKR